MSEPEITCEVAPPNPPKHKYSSLHSGHSSFHLLTLSFWLWITTLKHRSVSFPAERSHPASTQCCPSCNESPNMHERTYALATSDSSISQLLNLWMIAGTGLEEGNKRGREDLFSSVVENEDLKIMRGGLPRRVRHPEFWFCCANECVFPMSWSWNQLF